MSSESGGLRERTNGWTVTPRQYVWFATAALIALTLIVLTGAAVRLSGSGLGCPTWPKCYGKFYPASNGHSIVEFTNRTLSVPLILATGLAWVAALRRRPRRRDLVRISALLPLGVVAQAVLGGLSVLGSLDYGWVMAHFSLSMLILVAAVLLLWRSLHEPGEEQPPVERSLVIWARAVTALGALTLFAGTAATAAGPHAGGSPGQKVNRLSFDGTGTMDFVIHRHGEIAFIFGLAAVALWFLARRREAPQSFQRPLSILLVLLIVQGAVGLDQYETHLPTELVWVHVTLSAVCWLTTIWAVLAAGRLAPSESGEEAETAAGAPLAPLSR